MNARQRTSVCEISAHLERLEIGEPSALETVLPRVRELVGCDNILIYGVSDHLDGWKLSRWHQHGNAAPLQRRLARLFENSDLDQSRDSDPRSAWTSTGGVVFYNPRRPHPSMRNRIVSSTRAIGHESWMESRTCREVFSPVGMEHHEHYRALICEGDEMLAWFGTVTPGPLDREQCGILEALVPSIRQRLVLERMLDIGSYGRTALAVLLENIEQPAILFTKPDGVLHANAGGRALLDEHRNEVLTRISAGGAANVRLTRIASTGTKEVWLAVLKQNKSDDRLAAAVEAAAQRWPLTKRQRHVLAAILAGQSNAMIAEGLGTTTRSVELHVSGIFDRVGVESRAALIARVLTQ